MENARTRTALRFQFAIFNSQLSILRSVVFLQIHAFVQARDLLAVAIEHQGLAPEEFADAPLAGLTPTRVVDFRVDVRVKAVLLRLDHVARWFRLGFHETDL